MTLEDLIVQELELRAARNAKFTELDNYVKWTFHQKMFVPTGKDWDFYYVLQREYIDAVKALDDCYQAQHDLKERANDRPTD